MSTIATINEQSFSSAEKSLQIQQIKSWAEQIKNRVGPLSAQALSQYSLYQKWISSAKPWFGAKEYEKAALSFNEALSSAKTAQVVRPSLIKVSPPSPQSATSTVQSFSSTPPSSPSLCAALPGPASPKTSPQSASTFLASPSLQRQNSGPPLNQFAQPAPLPAPKPASAFHKPAPRSASTSLASPSQEHPQFLPSGFYFSEPFLAPAPQSAAPPPQTAPQSASSSSPRFGVQRQKNLPASFRFRETIPAAASKQSPSPVFPNTNLGYPTLKQANGVLLDTAPRAPELDSHMLSQPDRSGICLPADKNAPLNPPPISWLKEAMIIGLRQYPDDKRAALFKQLKAEPHKFAQTMQTWFIAQILRECYSTRNLPDRDPDRIGPCLSDLKRVNQPLPDFLAPFAQFRPNNKSLTLKELMDRFNLPEDRIDALTPEEKAAILMGAQLDSPALFSPRAEKYAQNIKEIAAKVAAEMDFVPSEELLDLLEPLVENSYYTPLESLLDRLLYVQSREEKNILRPILLEQVQSIPVSREIQDSLTYQDAIAGNPESQLKMGEFYEVGDEEFEIAPSLENAKLWYKLAAQSEYYPALANFQIFEENPLERKTPVGRAGLLKLAKQGDLQALNIIAQGYEFGINGFDQSDASALEYYFQAAKLGCKRALDKIKIFYENRIGNVLLEEMLKLYESVGTFEPLEVPPNHLNAKLDPDELLYPDYVTERDFHLNRIIVHRQALTRIHLLEKRVFDNGVSDPFVNDPKVCISELHQFQNAEIRKYDLHRDFDKDEILFPTKRKDEEFHLERVKIHQKAIARIVLDRIKKNQPDDGLCDDFIQWGSKTDPQWARQAKFILSLKTSRKKI